MWLGFDFRTRRHIWVESVVGSRSCSERFFPGYSGFPSPQKPTFPSFQFDLNYSGQALYHEPLAQEIAQTFPILLTSNKLLYFYFLLRLCESGDDDDDDGNDDDDDYMISIESLLGTAIRLIISRGILYWK